MASRVVPPSLLCLATASCVALAGLEEPTDDPEPSLPPRPADASADRTPDVADAKPPCAPGGSAEDGPGRIHAVRADVPPEIDGVFDDWGCADKLSIGAGALERDGIPATSTADVAIMWDDVHLYFWAKVTVENPSNTFSADLYANDSVHLFVAADMPGEDYRIYDHQLVFDVRRQVADFGDVAPTRRGTGDGILGVTAKIGQAVVSGTTSTFEVEARLDAGILNRQRFERGDRIRVNFQVNDGAPNTTTGYRIWFHSAAVCQAHTNCSFSGSSEPYCDPRCTGEVTLQ